MLRCHTHSVVFFSTLNRPTQVVNSVGIWDGDRALGYVAAPTISSISYKDNTVSN